MSGALEMDDGSPENAGISLLIYFFVQKAAARRFPLEMDRHTHSVKFTYYSTLFSLSLEIVLQVWDKREIDFRTRSGRSLNVSRIVYKEPDSVHHYYRKLYNFSIKENQVVGYGALGSHIYDYTKPQEKRYVGWLFFLCRFPDN